MRGGMNRFILPLFALAASLAVSACGPSGGPSFTSPTAATTGLGFLPKNAERGTLFRYYQPQAKAAWKSNWTSAFDLTGVSWNDPTTATLIAPQFVVMAAHYPRSSHVPVVFHDKDGNPYERFVIAKQNVPGVDVAVGKLNLPLPAAVKRYRLASVADATLGRPVIITDQTKTLSVHRIGAVSGNAISFVPVPGLSPFYGRNLVKGDSGNPTFIVKNGDLVLLETHTTGGPGAGPFYGSPQVQAGIREAISSLGN